MMKFGFFSAASLLLMPVLLTAAPASTYGKALQRARNVSSQAEASRRAPAGKPASRPAVKTAPNRAVQIKNFSQAVFEAKLKRYPVSGAAGINELLKRKNIAAVLPELKRPVSEKKLSIAWFGAEANRVKNKGVFPLFFTKPAFGPVIVGFTDGKVVQLKQRPRTVTGVIHILRSTAKNKKSSLWSRYQSTAGKIDRASK